MLRRILILIALICLMATSVQAKGLTVWGLTEQVTSVNSDNAITGRAGWMFGEGDNGGLELFVGSIWRVRDSEPQVIVVGAIQHLPDLIDPNSVLSIPYISDFMLSIMNEDVTIRPYIGAQCTINLMDQDAGFVGAITGVAVKLTAMANSELVFEMSYDNTFGDLDTVPDNELKGYMGFRIPF